MPLKIDGKEYIIPNIGKIILYPIGKVSQALTDAGFPRDTQTIRKWEISKIIPKAPFSSGQKRLYSIEHINALVKVVKELNIRQGAVTDSNLNRRVIEEWIKVNKKLKEKAENEKTLKESC